MNMLTIKKVAFGIALTTSVFAAKAQKTLTKGTVNYNINIMGNDIAAKLYFTADSSALVVPSGPATIETLGTSSGDYFAVLVNVPVMQKKVAAVLAPGEIEEAADTQPSYTFTTTTETKKIGDYNCVKYIAKEAKSGASYDLWVTNDLKLPANVITKYFSSVAGTPVSFTFLAPSPTGKSIAETVTISSVTEDKPANAFKVPADYDRVSIGDLKNMFSRRQ